MGRKTPYLILSSKLGRQLPEPWTPPSDDAFTLASQLVKGHAVVEVLGFWSRKGDNPLDSISLPELRPLSDYPLAPCKHECSLIKQARHVRQALEVFEATNPVKQAMMWASTCHCGIDSAHCSASTVRDVARMDCHGSMAHAEMSEVVLYTSTMHHRFGLPYDYAKLEDFILPESCP